MKLLLATSDAACRDGTETILTALPVWARSEVVQALTGLPDSVLRRLYNDGLIRVVKSQDARNAACVYRLGDVLEWMDTQAPKPPRFRTPQDSLSEKAHAL